MSSLSEPFIRRPVMTILLSLSAIVFGIFTYLQLPVSNLPDVDYPVIQVKASYPGANPIVMSTNVAAPLEQEMLKIPGIAMVVSNSTQGISNLILKFRLDKDIDVAGSDVEAAITNASGSLPTDMPSPPTYAKDNPNEEPVMYIGAVSTTMTQGELYDAVFMQIAQRLKIVDGVSAVDLYGSPRAVRVEVNPERLYNLGLTYADITQAVQQSSSLLSAGNLKGKNMMFSLEPDTQLDRASQYGDTIIAMRDGFPIYLRDIADAIDSIQTEDLSIEYSAKGFPEDAASVVMAIRKEAGANNVKIAEQLEQLLPELERVIPPSIQVAIIYDKSKTIIASIKDVQETLLIAFVLVCMVIFLFLGRARDTLIPVTALPLSLLLTFIIMRWLNYTIDNLSLMALTLSIGFLVDDAVVFLENMVRRMQSFGEGPFEAAINGAKEISFTILAMTVSLAAVFIPIIYMEGMLGRLFREFGVTIMVAVMMSGLVSLTLTPLMCARMLKQHSAHGKAMLEEVAYRLESWCISIYSPSLWFFLRHRWISLVLFIIFLFGTYHFFMIVPKTDFPVGDSSFISGAFVARTGTSATEMKKHQAQIKAMVKKNPAVSSFVVVTGAAGFMNSNIGFLFISLKDRSKRAPISEVNRQLMAGMLQIPGIIPAIRPQPTLSFGIGATSTTMGNYAFSLSGMETEEIYEKSKMLVGAMGNSGLFSNVKSDLYLDNPEVSINLQRERAAVYGVSSLDLSNILKDAYSQNYSYLIKGTFLQYQVIVEAAPRYRRDIVDLNELYFQPAFTQSSRYTLPSTGSPADDNFTLVPFSTVAKIVPRTGPLAVNHINGFSSVTLFYDLAEGISIGEANDFITATAKKLVPDYIIQSFEGNSQTFAEAVAGFIIGLILAVFVMYIVLGILYESYIHPITVLSSLPVALVGGLATLVLLGQDLSFYAVIGLFMLMGIVKKNGIMMIDFAIMRQEEGMSPVDAVHEASMQRFRPIIMTTAAALLGVVPIALGWGADGEARKPLGSCIVGGLVISQFVTLYITPVLYLYFEKLQQKMDKIPFFARGERVKI